MRGFFARMASLAAISFGLMAAAKPAPAILLAPPRGRINGHNGRSNNPRGTVPNRGLKRIQGRQAARG